MGKVPHCLRVVLIENVHRVCKNIWFLYLSMLCFYSCFAFMFAHMYAFIWYQTYTSSEQSRLEFHTFEKWCNVSYSYVSYIKSETSAIWRAGAWVEENHISHLVKSNSTIVTKFFWEMEKPALSEKFQTLTKIFKPKLISSLNLY